MNRITLDAITRQADAMAVDVFEIGLYKPAVDGKANEPEMLPRTWDKATLLKSVGWLKYQNSQGRNIYIRPKGEHALSLVDDLNAAALDRMKSEGFQPAIVVETSPGNFQAWLNHGRVLPRAESTAAARALAERFGGDRGAADWRHFGRLAGLTNRKPKYESNGMYPFVRLVEATGQPYSQRQSLVDRVYREVEIARKERTAHFAALVPTANRAHPGQSSSFAPTLHTPATTPGWTWPMLCTRSRMERRRKKSEVRCVAETCGTKEQRRGRQSISRGL